MTFQRHAPQAVHEALALFATAWRAGEDRGRLPLLDDYAARVRPCDRVALAHAVATWLACRSEAAGPIVARRRAPGPRRVSPSRDRLVVDEISPGSL
jgi:hypothetical protein